MVLSALQQLLLIAQFYVLGSLPLRCVSSFLPSWSRSKWWSAFSRLTFKLLYWAPNSTLASITGVSSTSLPLHYNVMTSHCSPTVGKSSLGGGTRVPFYLVGDIIEY